MGRLVLSSILVLGFVASGNAVEPSAKKLIEWGWDEPNTEFLKAHVAEMERLPFDGLVFHLSGPNFTWEMWGHRRFQRAEFDKAVAELEATTFHRLTERFLRVNVTPGDVDWFNDHDWRVVLDNFALAARIAKQHGCRGLLFDTEQYQASPFSYVEQRNKPKPAFGAFQAKVKERGREWIRAVNREFPDVTIIITFGYETAQPQPPRKDRSQSLYGLLPDFFDGVLSACTRETRLVDGYEPSYGFKQRAQFQSAYHTIRTRALDWTGEKNRYRQHVRAGFALWMDNGGGAANWNVADPAKNYFSPAAFEEAVRAALATTDEYVWIYTERPRWWTNERVPPAYLEAVKRAR